MSAYTDEQIEYLKRITPGRKNTEITKMFNNKFNQNRTESAIKNIRQRYKIKSKGIKIYRKRLFTKEQEEFILKNSETLNHDLVKMINEKFNLNITYNQMRNWRKNHRKPSGVSTRFKEGHEAWNKGKKGLIFPGSEKGWFKKGDKPYNEKEIGTIITKRDGYKIIKVSDTGHQATDWQFLHIHEWEKVNGKVPEKHVVVFLDSDKDNTHIDNLTVIHRRILAEMNKRGYFTTDPKATLTGIAICQLRDKLNEHEYMQGDRELYEKKKHEAELNGIKEGTFLKRLQLGWSIDDAATLSLNTRYKKRAVNK